MVDFLLSASGDVGLFILCFMLHGVSLAYDRALG